MEIPFIRSGLYLLFALCISFNNSFAQIQVTPLGISANMDVDEELSQAVNLSSILDGEVSYRIKFTKVDRGERREGPIRDDLGDVIAEHRVENGRWCTGIAWDGEEMWGYNHNGGDLISYNPETDEVTNRFNAGFQSQTGLEYADGELWIANRASGVISRFNVEGDALESIRVPRDVPIDIAWDGEDIWYTCLSGEHQELLYKINFEGDLLRTVRMPGDWDGWASMEFVEEHPDGQMRMRDHGRNIYQMNIEGDDAEVIQTIRLQLGNEFGLSHDGENLWYTYDREDKWIVVDDGVDELYWLAVEPKEGVIEANGETELSFTFNSTGLENELHEFWIDIEFPDNPELNIRMSAILTVGGGSAAITGLVTDAETGDPIPSATAALDYFIFARHSSEDGAYALADLPLGAYTVTFTAPDYLPTTEEVDLGENGVELNVELLHAECNLSEERIDMELAPDSDTHINFNATNDGNGPLTYTVDRRLIGDANAAPWELRRGYEVGNILEDDRIEGVAFNGENFYLAGANGNDPNTIYILDREGDPVGEFVQPGESRYGMKDLEWDGDLLWGGADQDGNVIGFDTEGNVAHSFRGPFNPTNNIAYDPVNEILWLSGTTTNIAGYTREGQATGVVLNRRNLRIYGLAYWPDDPDGYPLYILNQPAANVMVVHKMNPANGDTLRVRNIAALQDASPGGAFICNTFDVYSWVMMFTNNVGANLGGDRNYIYQLDARKEWFMVEPVEGMIDAGESQEFDLHLNAAGLPAVTFEGELLFTHDGVGSATILPIRLDVVEGPVHSQRNLQLGMGWNLVSANLQPDEEDIVTVTQGLADAGNLIRVKDGRGNFYDVNSGFSNLEGWNVAEGYWLKVLEPSELRVEGITVMSDDPIGLEAGWQTVAYYPRRAVDALIALSGIANELQIAKDGVGNFYLPGYGYSNIGAMSEGHGYQLKVTEATELVYRTRLDGMNPASFADRGLSVYDASGRYAVHTPTGRNMSLLVKSDLADGTDVGVYAGDVLVGSGVIKSGLAGVAVWGDDPSTPTVDGAIEGDALTIRLRDDSGECEASTTLLQGELTYLTDDVVVAGVTATTMPVEFGLTNAYPNPFNAVMRLEFALETTDNVRLALYDLSGREVLRLIDGRLTAGSHQTVISGESLSSGVYVVRLESSGRTSQMKVVLVK